MRPAGQPAAAAAVLSYEQVPANQMLGPRLVRSRTGQRARWTGSVRQDDIHRATELRPIDCSPLSWLSAGGGSGRGRSSAPCP
jgi:hypothetical protein